MPYLKAAVLSLRDVIAHAGPLDRKLYDELGRLVRFLSTRGITPFFLGNRPWTFQTSDGKIMDLRQRITADWGEFPWHVAVQDGPPFKPKREVTEFILNRHSWKRSEVIYIGNTTEDMQTAVNGGLLFLNAKWHKDAIEHGFSFSSPLEIARFVDIFCLREHLWYFVIEDGNLRFYSLGPFSTKMDDASWYSHDARNVAKQGFGNIDFWTQCITSTLYLSGLSGEFDYATVYPGHTIEQKTSVVADAMVRFTNCMRKKYLPDLIVRHTDAPKLQYTRLEKKPVHHSMQLNTIRLRPDPLKGASEDRYKNPPLSAKKGVLVVDDFCTEGLSLEAARNYLRQTGAKVILLSWLKTVNRDYKRIDVAKPFNPYVINKFPANLPVRLYGYERQIVDRQATGELAQRFRSYRTWNWPADIL